MMSKALILIVISGVVGILINLKSFLMILMYLEYLVLGGVLGVSLMVWKGLVAESWMFSYFLMGVIEGVLGLSLLVLVMRKVGYDFMFMKNLLI